MFRGMKAAENFPVCRDDQTEQLEGRSTHNNLLEQDCHREGDGSLSVGNS